MESLKCLNKRFSIAKRPLERGSFRCTVKVGIVGCARSFSVRRLSPIRRDVSLTINPKRFSAIHLRQSLLHALNVPTGTPHEIISLSPVGPQPSDFLRCSERISKQTVGVQLHQLLTLLYIAF